MKINQDEITIVEMGELSLELSPQYDIMHRWRSLGYNVLHYWNSQDDKMVGVALSDIATDFIIEKANIFTIERVDMYESEWDIYLRAVESTLDYFWEQD